MRHIPASLVLAAIFLVAPSVRAAGDLITDWPAEPPPPAEAPAPLVAPIAPEPSDAPRSVVQAPRPPVVHAPEPIPPEPRFGSRHTMVFDGSLSASFGHLGYAASNSTTNTFGVEPSFDYFSSDGFSEGVSVFFKYGSGTSGIDISSRTVSYGATGHLGPNFWLGERVSFWPRVQLGLWQSRSKYSGGFGGEVSVDGLPHAIGPGVDLTEEGLYVELFAPFLFHLAPHFFVGFGPDAYTDLFHDAGGTTNRRRFLGASSTVGGWF